MTPNVYDLSRYFWDYSFNNPELIKPNHCAVYFFAIEHCNRLGWKEKFGFPTSMVMEATGIKSYNTYKEILKDLVKFGFIKMIEISKNQYSSNIIALSKNDKAHNKALDKALMKHGTKQSESTVQSNDSIDKPIYNITNKQIYKEQIDSFFSFSDFWSLYPNKVAKSKCEKKYYDLKLNEIEKIKETLPMFVNWKQFDGWNHPNPETYLNQKRWNDVLTPFKPKTDCKIQTDSGKIGFGKTWDEMTFEEKKKNKAIATSEQLIKFNNEHAF